MVSLSIVSLDWLKSQNESTDGLYIFEIEEKIKYGIRSKNKNRILKKGNKEKIEKNLTDLHPFNYLFIGEKIGSPLSGSIIISSLFS